MFEALTREPQAPAAGRALDMGRIYDSAVELYAKHFTLLVLSVAVFVVPATLIRTAAYSSSHGAGLIVGSVVDFLANVGSVAVVAVIVRDLMAGEQPTVGRSLRRTLGMIVPLFLTFVLVLPIVGAGLLLLVLPGVLFAVWFVFSLQVVVFEGTSYWPALARSRRLVLGEWWRVFGILLLAGSILILAGTLSAQILAQFLGGGPVLVSLAGGIVDVITGPLLALIQTLLFLDVRFRNEGADLRAAIDALPEP